MLRLLLSNSTVDRGKRHHSMSLIAKEDGLTKFTASELFTDNARLDDRAMKVGPESRCYTY